MFVLLLLLSLLLLSLLFLFRTRSIGFPLYGGRYLEGIGTGEIERGGCVVVMSQRGRAFDRCFFCACRFGKSCNVSRVWGFASSHPSTWTMDRPMSVDQ
jgi:hypothetical protein